MTRSVRLPRMTAALLVTAGLAVSGPAAAKRVDRDFHESFDVSQGARLELIHGDGDVFVERWDRNVIDVTVRYRAELRSKGLSADPDFEVDFEQNGDTVRVRGREIGRKGIGFFFSQEHEHVYEIKAPDWVRLDLTGDDGDVTIEGWRAEIECQLDDGDLVLTDVRSNVTRISAEDGDVLIDGFSGRLDIKLDDGDVDIVDCETEGAKIRAEDGDVVLDRCIGDFEIAVDDGLVRLTRANVSKLDIRAADGDVDLDLVAATDLDLYVNAEDGDVTVDLGPSISAVFTIDTDDGGIHVGESRWILSKKERRVTGEIGGGDGQIRIRTDDGDVTLD